MGVWLLDFTPVPTRQNQGFLLFLNTQSGVKTIECFHCTCMITSRCTLTALLLATALFLFSLSQLSFLSQLLSSPPSHSSPLSFVVTALHSSSSLHSSPPCLLVTNFLSYSPLFVLSSPTFHSSPHFLLLLLSSTALLPPWFITCLPRFLPVLSCYVSPSI